LIQEEWDRVSNLAIMKSWCDEMELQGRFLGFLFHHFCSTEVKSVGCTPAQTIFFCQDFLDGRATAGLLCLPLGKRWEWTSNWVLWSVWEHWLWCWWSILSSRGARKGDHWTYDKGHIILLPRLSTIWKYIKGFVVLVTVTVRLLVFFGLIEHPRTKFIATLLHQNQDYNRIHLANSNLVRL
jgi:hypothetical protein